MILTDDKSDPPSAAVPPTPIASSSSHTERTPLLLRPSTASPSLRSSSPPPSYSPPALLPPTIKPRRRSWPLRIFFILLVAALILSRASFKHDSSKDKVEKVEPSPLPSPSPPTPLPPSLPTLPTPEVDEGSLGRRWNTSFYLPHLEQTFHASPTGPNSCNRRLPSNYSSSPDILRSAYALPLDDQTLLFLRFGTVQARPKAGGDAGKVEPNGALTSRIVFKKWIEEEAEIIEGIDWLEDRVLVMAEMEMEPERQRRDWDWGAEVCMVEGRGVSGMVLLSSSPTPPAMNITVYIPSSPASDRTMGNFKVCGLEGSLDMDDMEPNAFDDSASSTVQERSWASFEVKAKKAAIYIKSLAVHALSLSNENSSISLDNVRVIDDLDVHATGQGSWYGNISLVAGSRAAVHVEAGLARSIVSLIAPTADSPLPHLTPSNDEGEQALPGLPSKKLPSLDPVKISMSSSHGNVTAAFQRHLYHVPLQLDVKSDTGSVGVNLSPHFQGSIHLSSPIGILTTLPEVPPFPLPDPYGLQRKFRVVLTKLKAVTTGYMGWGFAGTPDMPGSLQIQTDTGVIGVARFGGKLPFIIE